MAAPFRPIPRQPPPLPPTTPTPANHPGDMPGKTPDKVRPITQQQECPQDATHSAEGRRQKAEGRMQKPEGKAPYLPNARP
jgi:hypothetical protein